MKQHASLWVALVALGMGACERHEWEETKQLYEDHEGHGKEAGHGDGEGDGEKSHAGGEKHD